MSKRTTSLLKLALLPIAAAALSTAAFAQGPVDPGEGPPDCPGMPGAFISSHAQELIDEETPPGMVISQIAQVPDGRGAGDEVQEALVEECGIGALPQED